MPFTWSSDDIFKRLYETRTAMRRGSNPTRILSRAAEKASQKYSYSADCQIPEHASLAIRQRRRRARGPIQLAGMNFRRRGASRTVIRVPRTRRSIADRGAVRPVGLRTQACRAIHLATSSSTRWSICSMTAQSIATLAAPKIWMDASSRSELKPYLSSYNFRENRIPVIVVIQDSLLREFVPAIQQEGPPREQEGPAQCQSVELIPGIDGRRELGAREEAPECFVLAGQYFFWY